MVCNSFERALRRARLQVLPRIESCANTHSMPIVFNLHDGALLFLVKLWTLQRRWFLLVQRFERRVLPPRVLMK